MRLYKQPFFSGEKNIILGVCNQIRQVFCLRDKITLTLLENGIIPFMNLSFEILRGTNICHA